MFTAGLRRCSAPLCLMTYSIHQIAFSVPFNGWSSKIVLYFLTFSLYLETKRSRMHHVLAIKKWIIQVLSNWVHGNRFHKINNECFNSTLNFAALILVSLDHWSTPKYWMKTISIHVYTNCTISICHRTK